MVVIGGGAAGLMAACRAGELGLKTILLERKHRVGSKVLMCGNGRCNLTSDLDADTMLSHFGLPLDTFLAPAIRAFPPRRLQAWFAAHRLPVMKTSDGKVFPRSERAPDVVHCLTDALRDLGVSVCLNAVVESVAAIGDRWNVGAMNFAMSARCVLVATGGVSYPKTGSVGDGQRFARDLGHRVTPFRPGLVGVACDDAWHRANLGREFTSAHVRVFDGDRLLGETEGLLECERWGLGGGAILNATRLLSRAGAHRPRLEIRPERRSGSFVVDPVSMRPLKEAMVTVGGVALEDVDPQTMASRRCKGLYFAGEVLDVDGPTGGYNLTAAFGTGRLAVESVARNLGVKVVALDTPPRRHERPHAAPRKGSHVSGRRLRQR